MRRHVSEVHEGTKNHKCKECGKAFARLEKLRAHAYIHKNGDHKPFLCHQCGRGFGRQEHVSRHQKICGKKKNKSRLRLRADAPITDDELEKIAVELGINNVVEDAPDAKYPCKYCTKTFRNRR
jgi:transcriptional regulator NrdR family protein